MQNWPQPFPFLVLRIRTLTHPWEKDLLRIMGLLLLLEYGLAASTVAVSWSGYFVSLLRDFGGWLSLRR